jgi:hypothetical protein
MLHFTETEKLNVLHLWYDMIHIMIYILLQLCIQCSSLTLREESRLSVFENMVLMSMFEPKREDVTGKLRKLHNEELHYLFFHPLLCG